MASRDFTSKSHSNFMHMHIVFLPPPCTHTVPGRNITTQNGGMLSDTSFTVTVNLPITEYRPDQLQIIVFLNPNDTAPVVADFPASYQYTVMFSGLMAGTIELHLHCSDCVSQRQNRCSGTF